MVVEIVGREVVRELTKTKFFNDLGDKGKIRDWIIVHQFFSSFWSSDGLLLLLFEERCNKSSFENFRKDARG